MNIYIVNNGTIFSSDKISELPNLLFVGIEWSIFEAISEKDALYQYDIYKNQMHPRQRKMDIVFEKIRFLDDEKSAKNIIMTELFPPPPDLQSIVKQVEAIGYTSYNAKVNYSKKRYWIAEITGFDRKYGLKRKFIKGKTDFTNSNKRASRGVYLYYVLTTGKIYEVSSPISNNHTDRYFCYIKNGQEVRLSDQEVSEWLSEVWV